MELVLIYVVVIALVATIPLILDICLAYRTRNVLIQKLIEKTADKLAPGELKEIVKESGKALPGITGLARSTMALTVIVILGVAVFHLLGKSGPGDNSQIIGNVLSMLGGLLAAITGFYFGGKAAAEKKTGEG